MTLPAPAASAPAQTAPSAVCGDETFSYTIQRGDTLWKLSKTHGVSVRDILDLNPNLEPQNLRIGEVICIPLELEPEPPVQPKPPIQPKPPAKPGAPSDTFLYRVRKCDTICGIAKAHYVSVDSIIRSNPDIQPFCLREGSYLLIPMNRCSGSACRYTVKAGDTLNRIANLFNVSPEAILAANPNVDFQNLVKCQRICIPNR